MQGSSPGEVLREARRSRDLSVEYIARQLRLTVTQIDALENDDFRDLPASIFVQGYIRSYATLLGLDSAPLVERYVSIAGEVPKPSLADPLKKHREEQPRHVLPFKNLSYIATSGFIVLAMMVIYNTNNGSDELEAPAATTVIADKNTNTGSTGPTPGLVPVSMAIDSSAVQSGKRTKTSKITKKSEHDTLSIRFKRSTYVEVFDATNKALLAHTGRAGFRDKVKGKAPFRIILGKPEHVEVHVNGQLLNHLRLTKKGSKRSIMVNRSSETIKR